MSQLVTGGLGQPERGALVAGGLGISEPVDPNALRGAATGSSTAVATLVDGTLRGTSTSISTSTGSVTLVQTGTPAPAGGGGVVYYRPTTDMPPAVCRSRSRSVGRLTCTSSLAARTGAYTHTVGLLGLILPLTGESATHSRTTGDALHDDLGEILALLGEPVLL